MKSNKCFIYRIDKTGSILQAGMNFLANLRTQAGTYNGEQALILAKSCGEHACLIGTLEQSFSKIDLIRGYMVLAFL